MGWLFYHRPQGESDRDHFAAKIDANVFEIIDCTTVNNVFYAAVLDKRDDSVMAWVNLIRRQRGEFNFGYKDMDERMGPGSYDCPPRILDLLTPIDSEWANQWRSECRKHAARKTEERAAAAKVVNGTVITVDQPLNFGDGRLADTFQLATEGRKRRWIANPGTPNKFLVRLPQDWASRYRWVVKQASDHAPEA